MAISRSLSGLANAAASDLGISRPGGFTIMELGPMVLASPNLMNAYVTALVNRINKTIIHSKVYNNALAKFKNGAMPYGSVSQHIFNNPMAPTNYDMNATNVFDVAMPDVKVVYFSQNSQKQFTVTVYRKELQKAFMSEEGFQSMVDNIINQLYSSLNIYEFERTKNIICKSFNAEIPIGIINEFGSISKTNASEFVASCRALSLNMTFPSTDFNNWAEYATKWNETHAETLNAEPVVTWSDVENQCLLIRADVLADIDVNVLAAAFNMNKASFMGNITPVNHFNETSADKYRINAVLCDRSFIQIDQQGDELSGIENPKALCFNNFLTSFQTYGTLPFANAVAFVENNPDYVSSLNDDDYAA